MRIPGWLIVAAAAVVAVPFGWMLGVLAAELIVGPEFGVFPVVTIPIGIAASLWFAVSRIVTPLVRLAIMAAGQRGDRPISLMPAAAVVAAECCRLISATGNPPPNLAGTLFYQFS
jgi:hypothetical protein